MATHDIAHTKVVREFGNFSHPYVMYYMMYYIIVSAVG